MSDLKKEQKLFEDAVYLQYYIRSIKRNENVPTPKFAGCMDFVPGKIEDKATFLKKDKQGGYERPELRAMWFGWQMGRAGKKEIQSDVAPEQ